MLSEFNGEMVDDDTVSDINWRPFTDKNWYIIHRRDEKLILINTEFGIKTCWPFNLFRDNGKVRLRESNEVVYEFANMGIQRNY